MMNVTSDYYRTRAKQQPAVECGLAERWMRSVRHAARAMETSRQDTAVEPLRPSNRTLKHMARRFKH